MERLIKSLHEVCKNHCMRYVKIVLSAIINRQVIYLILQKLIFPYLGNTELYFRTGGAAIEDGKIILGKNGFLRTDSFFNIFSAGKWFTYTDLQDLTLKITGKGRVKLSVFRLCNNDETEREVFSADLLLDNNSSVELPAESWRFPDGMIFFVLTAYEDSVIEKADYITKTPVHADIVMALNICTYRREEYVKANLKQLQDEILHNPESELCDKLEIFIADNGQTLGDSVATDKIHVFPNANTGGSGGFSRGLHEILAVCDEKKISYAIFMDDDIKIIPQVIERTAAFLSFIKSEFAECIIPGAILIEDDWNIQHEFGGAHGIPPDLVPLHKKLNLLDTKSLIDNDKEEVKIDYAGWWYSCMPISALKRCGYSMPFFISLDDVEYGMRLNLPFILLNGIGVWHHSFEIYRLSLIYYHARNSLVVNTLYNIPVKITNIIFNTVFWRTATYRYWDVEFFLKGVRDFCKGAQWLLNLDSEKNHAKLSKRANKSFEVKTIDEFPENFVYAKRDKTKAYNKLKTFLTLNGWLLPANKNVVLEIGTDAHEMYRVKKAIWYFPKLKQGIIVKKSFFALLKILFSTFYTFFIVAFRYKSAQKSYKKSIDKLHGKK